MALFTPSHLMPYHIPLLSPSIFTSFSHIWHILTSFYQHTITILTFDTHVTLPISLFPPPNGLTHFLTWTHSTLFYIKYSHYGCLFMAMQHLSLLFLIPNTIFQASYQHFHNSCIVAFYYPHNCLPQLYLISSANLPSSCFPHVSTHFFHLTSPWLHCRFFVNVIVLPLIPFSLLIFH